MERISQLLKPNGVAAVILPSSILNKENESFITARESLLKNFSIVAIATLGSKTFGATGTNTVILFLQKFDEPPKRTDMVIDSVEAILSKADIDGWEDESILRSYLKKICVKKDTYNEFLSKNNDYDFWRNDNYFSQHYNEFINSSEYTKKSKQKSFQKLSDLDQKKWFNQKFYEYAFSVEQEKLFYYSLVYNQDTLIISAPDENKEQEKFLGYKWSNRKGQEGIQIIKAGGYLYNASNREDNNSIAGLIRNAFSCEDEFDIEQLGAYYYRLRLQDMLDFSGTTFNKSIKTTPTRVLKDIPGLTNYKLSDKNYFDLSIGNRVLSDEVVENGNIPIYSANVYEEFGRIDKQNISDFSMPSIIWGIDGDWMVNIIPANKPFYPTDHCGVLRIRTDDIVPKYMALALQVEGEFERFSRSNRASTQRISNLIIQVPSVTDQQKIVEEIETIDKKIADEQAIISEQSEKVKSKFVEMFGDINNTYFNVVKIEDVCSLIKDGTHQTPIYTEDKLNGYKFLSSKDVMTQTINWNNIKYIPSDLHKKLYDNVQPKRNDILMAKNGNYGVAALNDTDEIFDIYVSLALLRPKQIINPIYFRSVLNSPDTKVQFDASIVGMGVPNLHLNKIKETKIMLPPINLQNQFADFAQTCDKLKFEAQKLI